MTDSFLAVLRDPMVVGLTVFVVGALVMAAVMAATTTQRWHDRHHQSRSELMCDHCRERQRSNPESAPRMRVLGESRRTPHRTVAPSHLDGEQT